MKFASVAAVAAASLFGKAFASLPSIQASGSKFFFPNGTQFFIRGVAYQQQYDGNGTVSANTTYTDPLTLPDNCKRDIPYLQQLYTNVIRVYAINPLMDHSECMAMLDAAGIYVIADLSAPVYGQSIDRDDPSWDDDLYARYTSVVDALQNYTNVIGFFAGNEVSNAPNTTDAAPFVKAAVRDTKAYIKAKGYRSSLGVGYATDDDASILNTIAIFFNCGTDQANAIDFFGYNIYSWCGNSDYVTSSYQAHTEFFSNYSVPAFFAEYGCNTVQPRTFTDVPVLYGDNMTKVWSGGIVYMYFEEANNYGLVTINADSSVSTLPGFSQLQSQLAAVTPSGVQSSAYSPSNTPAACPATASGVWEAVASPMPPSPNQELCECMYNSLSCVVSPSTSSDDYADLFDYVFSNIGDAGIPGIAHNGSTGDYGAYGMCNAQQQLGFAFNAYYQAKSQNSQACDFSGAAKTQSGSKPTSCSALLSQAGTDGTGTVTASPTGATLPVSTTGTSSSKGAAAGYSAPSVFRPSELGALPMFAVSALAVLSGMGMIFL